MSLLPVPCFALLKVDWIPCLVFSLIALPLRTVLALSEVSSHNATAPPEHFWLIPSIQCACAGTDCENVKQASGESLCTPGWGLYKCSLLSTSAIFLLQQSQVLPGSHQCYLGRSNTIWGIFLRQVV